MTPAPDSASGVLSCCTVIAQMRGLRPSGALLPLLATALAAFGLASACGGDSVASQPAPAATAQTPVAGPTQTPAPAAVASGPASPTPEAAPARDPAPSQPATRASATDAAATSVSNSTPRPLSTTAPDATATPAATQAPAAGPESANGVPTGGALVTISTGSKGRYLVKEQLAGRNLPSDAVGETPDVSGTVRLGPAGAVLPGSMITVKVSTLKSDQARRDRYLRGSALQTDRYPEAKFEIKSAEGLPWPLPATGQATFKLSGNMTVHGMTRPLSWDATADFSAASATGRARTRFTFGEFGMGVPRLFFILSVEDNIRLELDFAVTIQRG